MGANQSASVGGVGGPGAIASASSQAGDAVPIVRGTPESEATVPMSVLGGPRISAVPMPVGRVLSQAPAERAEDLPLAQLVIGEPANPAEELPIGRVLSSSGEEISTHEVPVVENDTVAPLRTTVPKPRQRPLLTQATELRIHRLQLSAGEQHAECCVCFDRLAARPCVVFARQKTRTCPHIFHEDCAREVLATGGRTCPLCRRAVDAIVPLPAIDDSPEKWFAFFDLEGNGRLSRQQVVGALVSQFPIDQAKLEHELPGLWAQWDADGSGIDRTSFLDPDKGLLQYVRSRLLAEDLAPVAVARQRSWNLEPKNWFSFFDANDSGKLTRDQLLRALVKTNALLTPASAGELIDRLELLPPGESGAETITLETFLTIHQILVEASAQSENTQLERLMERLQRRGVEASREQALRALEEQGGHIGRAVNRLARGLVT